MVGLIQKILQVDNADRLQHITTASEYEFMALLMRRA